MARWNINSNGTWQDIPTVSLSTIPGFSKTTVSGWDNFEDIPYILTNLTPAIPTAFSSNNGDDINNTFFVLDLDKSLLREFKIFNRWGQLVFDDVSLGYWDGKYKGVDQPRDV